MENIKTNAKEYLKEFATSQPDWLKALIYDAIETNGNITDDRKKEIFNHLINGTNLPIIEPNLRNPITNSEIRITELIHRSGVNALKDNQTIKFSTDVTILYGLNGAGKSSYFRILNEIVGGNQKKEIFSNIYAEVPEKIAVDLTFKEKEGKSQSISWDGTHRSLNLLNHCKVFDTSYLKGLLTKREADSTLIQPLGLNLFTYLVEIMDEFKSEIEAKADKKRLEKPRLELKYLSEEIKQSFEDHKINKRTKTEVENLYTFSEDNAQKLKSTQKLLLGLEQTNIQDKIRLKEDYKNELQNIKVHIEDSEKRLSSELTKTKELIRLYLESKEANELAKKQFEILSNIPSNNTEEWKEFIIAGEKYTSNLNSKEKVCAYCRQPLATDNSIQLVQSYSNFLQDESELTLKKVTKKLKDLHQKIDKISVELKVNENVQAALKEIKIENSEKNLSEHINAIISNIQNERGQLISIIKCKKAKNVEIELQHKDTVCSKLSEIIENTQREIQDFTKENSEKEIQIGKCKEEIKSFLENESIYKQKESFQEWFEIDAAEQELRKKVKKTSTTKISNESKAVHNALLTETLKAKFSEELTGLNSKLDVKIENTGNKKGISNTKLTLTKDSNITTVLSEGEQKAVALALFLAEVKIQQSINPIILDDPINSLDHKIAGYFANRLLQLENQIIIFNHDILFLNTFETSSEKSHICKTTGSDCNNKKGKHIKVYRVLDEGKNSKGVLTYYKFNKAENHIRDAKDLLKKSPFNESLAMSVCIRKAVECTIDEKILNNQIPTKYSTKNNRIDWTGLKKIKNDDSIIDQLKTIHGRVSGGGIHNGIENEENPITVDEFRGMISELEKILN